MRRWYKKELYESILYIYFILLNANKQTVLLIENNYYL